MTYDKYEALLEDLYYKLSEGFITSKQYDAQKESLQEQFDEEDEEE